MLELVSAGARWSWGKVALGLGSARARYLCSLVAPGLGSTGKTTQHRRQSGTQQEGAVGNQDNPGKLKVLDHACLR